MIDALTVREYLTLTMWATFLGTGTGLAGSLAQFVGGMKDRLGTGRAGNLARLFSSFTLLTLAAALLLNVLALVARYLEVRHMPAQTMFEVLALGTASGLFAMLLVILALRVHRIQGVMRGMSDLFLAIVLAGSGFTLLYILGMDSTGRALPPALQSYWFTPHIIAYTFSYWTLGLAYLAALLYLSLRVWRRWLIGEGPALGGVRIWGLLAFVFLMPFAQVFNVPVFLLAALVVLLARAVGSKMAWFETWDKGIDRFCWTVFLVGFPFLTAGLIQGALWAQEAWAIYWGWDSKEVSALISWLVYAIYLHLRFVAGWRGERGLWLVLLGGVSIFITFQLFGYLPASQSSLHRYTDSSVAPL